MMSFNFDKIYFIGRLVYKKIGILKSRKQALSEKFIKLYGVNNYVYELEKFIIKKYSLHIYFSIFSVLATIHESIKFKIFFIMLFNFICHYYMEQNLNQRVKQYRESVIEGFFEFSSQFTLMINAGLNYKNALYRIECKNNFTPYVEKAKRDIDSGVPEMRAFSEIPVQIREVVITRYFNCIVQAKKYGNRDVIKDLNKITEQNWNEKLKLHRKKAEELKVKLLFPMMFIFIGVLSILMLPVMIQFQFFI